MASLINRLKSLQEETPVELPDLSALTLAQLAKVKVSFGQKHMGDTYEKAWEDQQWINFMVSKYGSSKVLTHRRLIRFVELKVEEHEQAQKAIPVMPPRDSLAGYTDETSDHSGNRYILPKAKAQPAARYARYTGPPVPVEEEEEQEFEMYNTGIMDPPPLSQDPDFQAVQQRLLNMEDALTKVIRHLEDRAVDQNQP
jgi:hypothetical protein